MTTEVHEGPLDAAPQLTAPDLTVPVRKSWREQRWERRRRRLWLEELLGWILVPLIVIGACLFVDMALSALGTSPSAIINGLGTITSAL
jgi:hypothetical protein